MAPPIHEHLHDKAELEAFLALDPALHIYALGDLDPAYWPWTSWYGLRRDGALRELALCYTGLVQPVLMAFVQHDPADMAALLDALAPVLPPRFHAHLDLRCVQAAERCWALRPFGRMHKMVLGELPAARGSAALEPEPLGPAQHEEIRSLLDLAYPGNFFEPAMLASGGYLGLRRQGALIAVAGLHVCSPSFGAVALGNIAVHPEQRGQGLGRQLSHALCSRLRAQGVRHVGLNVRVDNPTAVALYRSLGFSVVTDYLEAQASSRLLPH